MKNLLSNVVTSLMMLCLSATIGSAKEDNLVKDGDFKDRRLNQWDVGVTKKYGIEIKPEVSQNSVTIRGMREMSPKYLTFSQYVDIEKGKKYRLTFDIRSVKGMRGKLTISVGRPGYATIDNFADDNDHLRPLALPNVEEIKGEWVSQSFDFTGIYVTDNEDARKMPEKELKKRWKEVTEQSAKAPTMLFFNLGGLEGEVSLRKVKIVEVQ